MRPEKRFLEQSKSFWAIVKLLSEKIGYSKRGSIKTPDVSEMVLAFEDLNLDRDKLILNNVPTPLAITLKDYFKFRARVLEKEIEPKLMDKEKAKRVFSYLKDKLYPTIDFPMNKQKGDKKAEAFFTCIINMLLEHELKGKYFDHDPRRLISVTKNGVPTRTLSRRVDGAFPSVINPIAIWEIKEYYYTTTFGSRIADGVYETLLDGLELEELRKSEGVNIHHYLMVDAYDTWWIQGKSYLCRMVDMLHMGYVKEILFGYEVVKEIPRIVADWLNIENTVAKVS